MDAEIEPAEATAGRRFEIEFHLLVEAIYHLYHYDFRRYAAASLRRRMKTAMVRFGCETLSQLQGRVRFTAISSFPSSWDRFRSIQVYVTGEARRPGVYTVSSLSTLVDALFASGGPSVQGSMRHIELRRGGATVVPSTCIGS